MLGTPELVRVAVLMVKVDSREGVQRIVQFVATTLYVKSPAVKQSAKRSRPKATRSTAHVSLTITATGHPIVRGMRTLQFDSSQVIDVRIFPVHHPVRELDQTGIEEPVQAS